MKVKNSKIIIFIAMIPLMFIFGTASAANVWPDKSVIVPALLMQQAKAIDANAIVLAKGQNHLPKKNSSNRAAC